MRSLKEYVDAVKKFQLLRVCLDSPFSVFILGKSGGNFCFCNDELNVFVFVMMSKKQGENTVQGKSTGTDGCDADDLSGRMKFKNMESDFCQPKRI